MWASEDYEIITSAGGKEAVKGVARGGLGIHFDGVMFSVTHMASGKRICGPFYSMTGAFTFADTIMAILEWDREDLFGGLRKEAAEEARVEIRSVYERENVS